MCHEHYDFGHFSCTLQSGHIFWTKVAWTYSPRKISMDIFLGHKSLEDCSVRPFFLTIRLNSGVWEQMSRTENFWTYLPGNHHSIIAYIDKAKANFLKFWSESFMSFSFKHIKCPKNWVQIVKSSKYHILLHLAYFEMTLTARERFYNPLLLIICPQLQKKDFRKNFKSVRNINTFC